jgi:Na+/melibiose symporter-like transporter
MSTETEDILAKILADYDRRRATRWGRFLLWLLRKTT